MKFSLATILIMLLVAVTYGQDSTKIKNKNGEPRQHRMPFVDANGDGYNDNAPDHDGDGIPNGLDPDWHKLHKGKGKAKGKKHRFIDLNGDGINDYIQSEKRQNKKQQNMLKKAERQGGPMDKQGQTGQRHRGAKKGGKH